MKQLVNHAVIILLVLVAVSFSQVTIESNVTSAGFYGIGGFKSLSKTMVQGDAKRTETQLKFTGTFMKHFSPKGKDIEITRLDKKLFWKFNDKDKKYTETTFAEIKEMLESGESMYEMPEQGQENPGQEEMESEYEWQEPVVEMKKLGDKATISGISCDHYLSTIMTIGKHKQTGILDTMLFKGDFWNSATTPAELEKALIFDQKVAEALGFNVSMNRGMAQFMQAFQEQAEQLKGSMDEMKGYPLKMDMDYSVTNHVAASQQTEGQAEAEEDESNDVDVNNLGGALGGMFGKKIAKMAEKKVTPKSEPGSKMLFQSSYEVTNIKTGSIDADNFMVPSNYKLQK